MSSKPDRDVLAVYLSPAQAAAVQQARGRYSAAAYVRKLIAADCAARGITFPDDLPRPGGVPGEHRKGGRPRQQGTGRPYRSIVTPRTSLSAVALQALRSADKPAFDSVMEALGTPTFRALLAAWRGEQLGNLANRLRAHGETDALTALWRCVAAHNRAVIEARALPVHEEIALLDKHVRAYE